MIKKILFNKKLLFLYLVILLFIIFITASRLFYNNIILTDNISFYIFVRSYYFLLISAFIIFIALKVRKENFCLYDDFILFSIIFLYSCFWINRGIDLTDEGFTISKSWFMFQGMFRENADFMWGTTLIGGLWLRLIGFASILWERIGYSLIISLIGLFGYRLLKKEFNSPVTFISVIAVSIIIRINIQTINYNLVPGFLIVISIYNLYNSIRSDYSRGFKIFLLLLSGFFLGFSILARFTNIIYLILPFIYFFINMFIEKDYKKNIRIILLIYTGAVSGILTGLFLMALTGSLTAYLKNIYYMFFKVLLVGKSATGGELIAETHSIKNILGIYLRDLWYILKYLSFSFFIIFPSYILASKVKNLRIKKIIFIIVTVFISLILFYYVFKYNRKNSTVFFFTIIIINLLILMLTDFNIKRHFFLIFWSLSYSIFSFLGSDVGIKTMFSSGGVILLFPLSIVLLYNSEIKLNNTVINFKYYIIGLLIVLLISGFIKQKKFIYRDVITDNYGSFSKIKELSCIYTNYGKSEVFDDIYNYFKKNVSFKKSRLLILNSQPLLYAILNHKYYFITPWAPWIFLDEPDYIEIKFNEYKAEGKMADYIIFPHQNSRISTWPITDSKYKASDKTSYEYFEKIVQSNDYALEYSNIGYNVYKFKNIK